MYEDRAFHSDIGEIQKNSQRAITLIREAAKNNASADDLIYVGGSIFVVAEVIN